MRTLRFLAAAVMVCAFGSEAAAQGVGASLDVETISPKKIAPLAGPAHLVYSVKFLCGTIQSDADVPQFPETGAPLLVPGTYLTVINIHNPNPRPSATADIPLTFRKKALITNPQGEDRGKVSDFFVDTLKSNEGLEIDCGNIKTLLGDPTSDLKLKFLKGFVVIEVKHPLTLDVVAVYTLKNVKPPPLTTVPGDVAP